MASWIKKFNLRGSSGFVADGTNETYLLTADSYPVTRNAATFGYISATGVSGADITSGAPYAPELSGFHSILDATTPQTIRFDLTAAGVYDLTLGIGDWTVPGSQGIQRIEIYDNVTLLHTINLDIPRGALLDANSYEQRVPQWQTKPYGNTSKRLTFASTICNVKFGRSSGAGKTTLGHIGLFQIIADQLGVRTNPAGAGATFAFAQQPIVEIRDGKGVLISGTQNVLATLNVVSGAGVLSGTTTVAAVAGVATFTNLAVSAVGTYNITFSSAGLTSVTTPNFTVLAAGAAVKVVCTTQPVGFTNEALFSTQPVFQLQTGGGVLVAGATDTVTIAFGPTAKGEFRALSTLSKAAVAGVCTFTDLVPMGWGSCNWVASCPGMSSATTNSLSPTGSFDGPSELPRSIPSKVPFVYDVTTIETAANIQTRINTIRSTIDALNYRIRYQDGENWFGFGGSLTVPVQSAGRTGYLRIESQTMPTTFGTRPQSSDFTTQGILWADSNAAIIIVDSPGGSVNTAGFVSFGGLRLKVKPGNPQAILGGSDAARDLIWLGRSDLISTIVQTPQNVTVERCWISGGLAFNTQQGIADSGRNTAIFDNRISEIFSILNDSQPYANSTGPGPVLIDNNFLEGTGESWIFGGGAPGVLGLATGDATITRNYCTQPLGLEGRPKGYAPATPWQSKNRGETKCVARALIEGNIFSNQFHGSQNGTLLNLTGFNNGNFGGWRDITVRYNVLHTGDDAIDTSALGAPSANAVKGQRLHIHDNAAYDIGYSLSDIGGQNHRNFLVGSDIKDLWIKFNTMLGGASGVRFIGFSNDLVAVPIRMQVEDNIVSCTYGGYSVYADGTSPGNPAIDACIPDYAGLGSFTRNILIGLTLSDFNNSDHPMHPRAYHQFNEAGVLFTDYTVPRDGDRDPDPILASLILQAGSPYHLFNGAKDSGADIATIRTKIAGVWHANEITVVPSDFGLRWRRKFHHRS